MLYFGDLEKEQKSNYTHSIIVRRLGEITSIEAKLMRIELMKETARSLNYINQQEIYNKYNA